MPLDRRPIVCLVTDRRRLCAACEPDAATRCAVEQAKHAVAADVDLVQVRERDLEASALVDLVGALVEVARASSTRVIVNDRLDVAIAADAAGVHLRADSMPAAAARRLAPTGFIIGRSVHDRREAAATSNTADYLVAGTVFPSESKRDAPAIGEGGLREIVESASIPVLAIGGVTEERIATIAAAGASGVAAIGMFLGAGRPCRATPLDRLVAAVRARFDG